MNNKVLLVSSSAPKLQQFGTLIRGLDSEISQVTSIQACRMILARQEAFDLLIVDEKLVDGSWDDALDTLISSRIACEIIVSSRTGDNRFWAEVLSRGGYDVLVEPYEQQEVLRIIQDALHSNHLKRFTPAPTLAVA